MENKWSRSELSELNEIQANTPRAEISKIKALSRKGTKKDIPYIIKALENPEKDVRNTAVLALGELGTEKEIITLQKLRLSDDFDTATVIESVNKIKKRLGIPLFPNKEDGNSWFK